MSRVDDPDPPAQDGEFRPEDWLSASETIRLVRDAVRSQPANITIATRAHAGLVRTRADLMMMGSRSLSDVEVPPAFWWAEGHEALTQNWDTGDFDTWLDQKVHLRAFGVRFHRGDVQEMVPQAFAAEPDTAPGIQRRSSGGRRMSELWPEWVAELTAQIHETGIPPGVGSQGTDELITRVAACLAERGLEAPSRSTVQETVVSVLRRLRSN